MRNVLDHRQPKRRSWVSGFFQPASLFLRIFTLFETKMCAIAFKANKEGDRTRKPPWTFQRIHTKLLEPLLNHFCASPYSIDRQWRERANGFTFPQRSNRKTARAHSFQKKAIIWITATPVLRIRGRKLSKSFSMLCRFAPVTTLGIYEGWTGFGDQNSLRDYPKKLQNAPKSRWSDYSK